MNKSELNHLVQTVKSGTEFTALVRQDGHDNTLTGKLEVGSDRFWMCFDEGQSGDEAPNKHNYRKSWVIKPDNVDNIISFTIKEPVPIDTVVNNYEIY